MKKAVMFCREKRKFRFCCVLMQFRDFMVLVLFGAILLSAVLGEYSDALVIMCIVVINAVLGFIQEYRAENLWRH